MNAQRKPRIGPPPSSKETRAVENRHALEWILATRPFGWENGGIVTQGFKLTIAVSTAVIGTQKVLVFPPG
jgi:hypothetical protein